MKGDEKGCRRLRERYMRRDFSLGTMNHERVASGVLQPPENLFLPALNQKLEPLEASPGLHTMPFFFADIVQPSHNANISRANFLRHLALVSRLAQLDEVRVLGEPAGIEVQRNLVLLTYGAYRRGARYRDRLPAA